MRTKMGFALVGNINRDDNDVTSVIDLRMYENIEMINESLTMN